MAGLMYTSLRDYKGFNKAFFEGKPLFAWGGSL